LCDGGSAVGVRNRIDIHTLPLDVSIPKGTYWIAGEDSNQEDRECRNNDVRHYDIGDDSESPRYEDLEVEHDEGDFDQAEHDYVG
jgi:hypothetical protein